MLDKIEQINKLEKKDIDLIIADFDDTIFCRKDQLEKSEILRNNRGDKGNEVIINTLGIDNVMNDFYINKTYPNTITSKLRQKHDLILTAGYKEIQEAKLKSTGLDIYNFQIVKTAPEKIEATIDYIINTLGFIPSKITIYEDRPKFFISNKDFLEKTIGTKIDIMFVEMIDNEKEPKITKVN